MMRDFPLSLSRAQENQSNGMLFQWMLCAICTDPQRAVVVKLGFLR